MAGLYCCFIVCAQKALRLSIRIIETAADFFADTKRILLVPALFFTVGILLFIAWLYGIICISSIGPLEGADY